MDRQERLCREVAEWLGLVVAPGCVFLDNNRLSNTRRLITRFTRVGPEHPAEELEYERFE